MSESINCPSWLVRLPEWNRKVLRRNLPASTSEHELHSVVMQSKPPTIATTTGKKSLSLLYSKLKHLPSDVKLATVNVPPPVLYPYTTIRCSLSSQAHARQLISAELTTMAPIKEQWAAALRNSKASAQAHAEFILGNGGGDDAAECGAKSLQPSGRKFSPSLSYETYTTTTTTTTTTTASPPKRSRASGLMSPRLRRLRTQQKSSGSTGSTGSTGSSGSSRSGRSGGSGHRSYPTTTTTNSSSSTTTTDSSLSVTSTSVIDCSKPHFERPAERVRKKVEAYREKQMTVAAAQSPTGRNGEGSGGSGGGRRGRHRGSVSSALANQRSPSPMTTFMASNSKAIGQQQNHHRKRTSSKRTSSKRTSTVAERCSSAKVRYLKHWRQKMIDRVRTRAFWIFFVVVLANKNHQMFLHYQNLTYVNFFHGLFFFFFYFFIFYFLFLFFTKQGDLNSAAAWDKRLNEKRISQLIIAVIIGSRTSVMIKRIIDIKKKQKKQQFQQVINPKEHAAVIIQSWWRWTPKKCTSKTLLLIFLFISLNLTRNYDWFIFLYCMY